LPGLDKKFRGSGFGSAAGLKNGEINPKRNFVVSQGSGIACGAT